MPSDLWSVGVQGRLEANAENLSRAHGMTKTRHTWRRLGLGKGHGHWSQRSPFPVQGWWEVSILCVWRKLHVPVRSQGSIISLAIPTCIVTVLTSV